MGLWNYHRGRSHLNIELLNYQSYGEHSKYKLFKKKNKHKNDNEFYDSLMLVSGKSLTKPVYLGLYVHHHCPFL